MKIKVMMGTAGCDEIINQLNDLKDRLNKADSKIVSTLAKTGLETASASLAAMPDYDGNDIGSLLIEGSGNSVRLVHKGNQVSFLEFGTGLIGASSPYPKAIPWIYDIDNEHKVDVDGKRGWFYYSKLLDKIVFTQGIVGGKNMYNASRKIRNKINSVVREAITR